VLKINYPILPLEKNEKFLKPAICLNILLCNNKIQTWEAQLTFCPPEGPRNQGRHTSFLPAPGIHALNNLSVPLRQLLSVISLKRETIGLCEQNRT
jgi:hypothetical protein